MNIQEGARRADHPLMNKNPTLTMAAWVAALALVVLAGVSAYTTFAEPEADDQAVFGDVVA